MLEERRPETKEAACEQPMTTTTIPVWLIFETKESVQSLDAAVAAILPFPCFPIFLAAHLQMFFGLPLPRMVIERDPHPARIYRKIYVPGVMECPWYFPSPPTAPLSKY